MERRIFVDAGAIVAAARAADAFHQQAKVGWRKVEKENVECVTTNLVLLEAMNYFQRVAGNRVAAERYEVWLASRSLSVVSPTRDVDRAAVDILKKYHDQRIGWTDCVSFVVMQHNRLDTFFGFDKHFVMAGLTPFTGFF